MTPAMVSGIAQTLPQIATPPSNSSPQLQNEASPKGSPPASKANDSVAADSVSISQQALQAGTNGSQEDPAKTDVTPNNTSQTTNSDKTGVAASKVQFVYDQNGELVTKYMDSSERIIYQIPSELTLRLSEFLSKSDSSVDTNV